MGRPSNLSRMILEYAMRAAEDSVTHHEMLTARLKSPRRQSSAAMGCFRI
jgi:hypothetical protein